MDKKVKVFPFSRQLRCLIACMLSHRSFQYLVALLYMIKLPSLAYKCPVFVSKRYSIVQMSNQITFIDRLRTEDIPNAAKVISDAIPLSSPHSWSRALNLPSSFEDYLLSYLPTAVNFHVGSYAERLQSDPTICTSVVTLEEMEGPEAVDYSAGEEEEESSISSPIDASPSNDDYNPYAALYGILNACKDIFYTKLKTQPMVLYASGKHVYVSWIATHDSFQRRGSGGRLLTHANTVMSQHDYDYAVAYCSHPGSTRLFQRAGYEVWGKIKYSEFEFEGRKPFSSLPDEVSVLVRNLRISPL